MQPAVSLTITLVRRRDLHVSRDRPVGYNGAASHNRSTLRAISNSRGTMNRNETPKNSRKLILFGLMLGAMSLFMYVSFILTTAFKGP